VNGAAPVRAGRSNSFRFSQGGNNSLRTETPSRANQSKNAQDTCLHFAERQSHLFNLAAPAFVFCAADPRGNLRFVRHTWRSILGNVTAANEVLGADKMAVWQSVLPLWTVEGMQVVLRALAGGNSFVLYRRFDPLLVLSGVRRYRVTHIAVDPGRLGLLLDEASPEFGHYSCVLVNCGSGPRAAAARAADVRIFKAARRASQHVRLAYGTPETSGFIAVEDDLVEDKGGTSFVCAMRPLPGCELRIMNPDAQGFGTLGVRTPGLFGGYLDEGFGRRSNDYFLTGDEAALFRERLYLR
ncbi:MAG: AMP-binding protein, partial [Eggerthellaceae bacterium]|nr:AMP-binding protein [Eggerthellaceae bacterium]